MKQDFFWVIAFKSSDEDGLIYLDTTFGYVFEIGDPRIKVFMSEMAANKAVRLFGGNTIKVHRDFLDVAAIPEDEE